jgi:replicative DNA helicase
LSAYAQVIEEDRGLPASEDSERTIMGAVLLDSARLLEIAAILKPEDFCLDSHRRIFAAMAHVCERDSTVDIVTLAQALADRKEIEAVGGVAYLASLTEGLPRRPEIDNYIKIVKDKALCRALIVTSSQLSARAYDQGESGLELVAWRASPAGCVHRCRDGRRSRISAVGLPQRCARDPNRHRVT